MVFVKYFPGSSRVQPRLKTYVQTKGESLGQMLFIYDAKMLSSPIVTEYIQIRIK